MANIDLKQRYKEHYSARHGVPSLVHVSERPFLMIDGSGDPNTSAEYQEALEALYPLAYGLRAAIKNSTGDAYVVMPLEGLWWVPDWERFSIDHKEDWLWTAMISLPEVVNDLKPRGILAEVTERKRLRAGAKARVEKSADGDAAQIFHRGRYADEGPTIATLHAFIRSSGHVLTGRHHEIYISDPRKTDPSKLRTVIRQPIASA